MTPIRHPRVRCPTDGLRLAMGDPMGLETPPPNRDHPSISRRALRAGHATNAAGSVQPSCYMAVAKARQRRRAACGHPTPRGQWSGASEVEHECLARAGWAPFAPPQETAAAMRGYDNYRTRIST